MAADSSLRVSKQTVAELERLREVFHTGSAEATIRKLVQERRAYALRRMIGSGRGRLSGFREEDRLATDG